jgi:hypothetical protein
MQKYVLAALLAMAVASGANAQVTARPSPTPRPVPIVDLPPRPGPIIYGVPDSGSTVALLGLSVALLVLAQRKFARAE